MIKVARRRSIGIFYWGSIDTTGCTVGDYLAAEAVSIKLSSTGVFTKVFNVNKIPFSHAVAECKKYFGAAVFVCGPFISSKKSFRRLIDLANEFPVFALGVSRLKSTELGNVIGILRDCETEGLKSFDLSLSHPYFEAIINEDTAEASFDLAACLRGEQTEYRAPSKHTKVYDIIQANGIDCFIDTTVNLSEPIVPKVLSVIDQFRFSSFIVSTRLHGALIAAAVGTPFIAIDQVGPTGKITAHGSIHFPLNLASLDKLNKTEIERMKTVISDRKHITRLRTEVLGASTKALERGCNLITKKLNW